MWGYLVVVGDDNDKFYHALANAEARKKEIENDYPRWAANHCRQQEEWDEPPSPHCSQLQGREESSGN